MLTKEHIKIISKIEEHCDVIYNAKRIIRAQKHQIMSAEKYIETLKIQYEMLGD